MPEYFLIAVIILFVLAILDLVVGVSNDAVNFLNSAIGSKVASRHVIMIVASLGIIAGASFSNGMIEVARKGIFNPEFFMMSEIMVIFLAVMITDIILLDLFNTFGMPTSTTVSIVFELLGAAVAVSFLKINQAGESLGTLGSYINSSSAILIISGIFISVLIAFVIGSFVQYLSRLLFTFHVDKRLKFVGPVWSGLALSVLTYFLLIKGANGASFITPELLSWIHSNVLILVGGSFIFWALIMYFCLRFLQVNILRVVVLFGTFALAMAFAGNDLVNFIGVPIAGMESFLAWRTSGTDPDLYAMSILNEPVRTQTYILILAGLIMVVTLWFSKKARSVTETEVNLGRQDEGSERFQPNILSQGIVRLAIASGKTVGNIIPDSWMDKAETSFEPIKEERPKAGSYDPPAFDLVRASVNLTTASVLIAFATSLKLPLSTTYVSFMVAMGTSLADRAWGRSSAVYRVAGVINVIGGWFFTAFMAFTAAATFACLIFFFEVWALIGLLLLAFVSISRTFILHKQKENKKAKVTAMERQAELVQSDNIIEETSEKISQTLKNINLIYKRVINGLLNEDRKQVQQALDNVSDLKEENELMQGRMYGLIKRIVEQKTEASRIYLLVYDLEQDIVQSIDLIVAKCAAHINNSLEPIHPDRSKELAHLAQLIDQYLSSLAGIIENKEFDNLESFLEDKSNLFNQLEIYLNNQILSIKADVEGMRNSLLFFTILLETKDLVAVAMRFVKLYQRVKMNATQSTPQYISGKKNQYYP